MKMKKEKFHRKKTNNKDEKIRVQNLSNIKKNEEEIAITLISRSCIQMNLMEKPLQIIPDGKKRRRQITLRSLHKKENKKLMNFTDQMEKREK